MTSDDFLRVTYSLSRLSDTLSAVKVQMEKQEARERRIELLLEELVKVLKEK